MIIWLVASLTWLACVQAFPIFRSGSKLRLEHSLSKSGSRYIRSIGIAGAAIGQGNGDNEPADSEPLTKEEFESAHDIQDSPADTDKMQSFTCDTEVEGAQNLTSDDEIQNTAVWFSPLTGDKWGKKTVYYNVQTGFNEDERGKIAHAIQTFEDKTCLKFVQRTNEDDYVNLVKGTSGCSSNVGKVGGKQDLNLEAWCAEVSGIVQHELMHAIGYLHEHQRPDRDAYVKIMWANIVPPAHTNFFIVPSLPILSYDYHSVMHYGRTAGSWNGLPAIVPLNDASIGLQSKGMSPEDVKKIKKVYCEDNSFYDLITMVTDQGPIVNDAINNLMNSMLRPFTHMFDWTWHGLRCLINMKTSCA